MMGCLCCELLFFSLLLLVCCLLLLFGVVSWPLLLLSLLVCLGVFSPTLAVVGFLQDETLVGIRGRSLLELSESGVCLVRSSTCALFVVAAGPLVDVRRSDVVPVHLQEASVCFDFLVLQAFGASAPSVVVLLSCRVVDRSS